MSDVVPPASATSLPETSVDPLNAPELEVPLVDALELVELETFEVDAFEVDALELAAVVPASSSSPLPSILASPPSSKTRGVSASGGSLLASLTLASSTPASSESLVGSTLVLLESEPFESAPALESAPLAVELTDVLLAPVSTPLLDPLPLFAPPFGPVLVAVELMVVDEPLELDADDRVDELDELERVLSDEPLVEPSESSPVPAGGLLELSPQADTAAPNEPRNVVATIRVTSVAPGDVSRFMRSLH